MRNRKYNHRFLLIVLAFILSTSFRNVRESRSIAIYKYYAFPANLIQNNLPSLPSIALILLNCPVLIYSTTQDLTIADALDQTPSLDFCADNDNYLCAAKIQANNGLMAVVEATAGDFYSF